MSKSERLSLTLELLKVVTPAVTRGVLACFNQSTGNYFYQVSSTVGTGIAGLSLQIADELAAVLEKRADA